MPFPFSSITVVLSPRNNAGHTSVTWGGTCLPPGPARAECWAFRFLLFVSSPCHATDTILRQRCASCAISAASQCGPVYVFMLAHFLQAVRRYASASPTAAFAGQKGSNVRLCTSPYASTSSPLAARVNIPLHLFREMVRQRVTMGWIVTEQ